MSKRIKWSLIEIPDHQGVMNVGGRIGAANGPAAFAKAFARLSGRIPVHPALETREKLWPVPRKIEDSHREAAKLVLSAHRRTGISVVVGGGHDHGFSQLQGIAGGAKEKTRLGCMNLDAHLDVRKPSPLITSGSGFYLALESGVVHPSRFIEFGIQSQCNHSDLWEYVRRKRVEILPFSRLRFGKAVPEFRKALKKLSSRCDQVVVSLDLDSAAGVYAPGVSSPQSEGFSAEDLMAMMEIAGGEKKVTSLGLFELNPEHDLDSRTARLAAHCAYLFLENALSR